MYHSRAERRLLLVRGVRGCAAACPSHLLERAEEVQPGCQRDTRCSGALCLELLSEGMRLRRELGHLSQQRGR